MRHFVVLGFSSHSKDDAGESLYLGQDRGAAIAATNNPDGEYARKEMHELATPFMRRHYKERPQEAAKKRKGAAKKD